MTPLKASLASLLTRRFAAAATLVTLAGGAAGGAAYAVVNTAGATPVAQELAATSAASPSPSTSTPAKNGHHRGRALVVALVRATAKETGLSAKTIRQDLRSGQTLDQIAGGKSGDVAHDVLSAIQARLDKLVDSGKITKQQETDRLAKATARIQTLMSTKLLQGTGK